MESTTLRDFLEEKVAQYNSPEFIDTDPISIPHRFNNNEDIEIAGFLTSTIAWGNRKMIIQNASRMMEILGESPYDFVMSHSDSNLDNIQGSIHRTFNHLDFRFFIKALRNVYENHEGLEGIFTKHQEAESLQPAISKFKKIFFEIQHPTRTMKHVSDPDKGSAAKRLNMWLRWLVRKDKSGVDFGIWKSIPQSSLSCPLDVHSGNVARKLGLLERKQNDSKAVIELDDSLRKFDPKDPVKYDFALFGLGVFERF